MGTLDHNHDNKKLEVMHSAEIYWFITIRQAVEI